MNHLGHVMVAENTGKFHRISNIENNPHWEFQSKCGYIVTDVRVMSPQKARRKGYSECRKCSDME